MSIKSIVILTGAGVSAESGIQTFRANDGLWEDHRIEDVATPEAFVRDPILVHRFYNSRRQPLITQKVSPNLAHLALARLQNEFSGEVSLITQNIDNLHERAGSADVIHMHGELLKMRCAQTNRVFRCETDISIEAQCDCCRQMGNLRPHVVWFGEMPIHMEKIQQVLQRCDLFVAIGTSGNVYPAAGFVQMANLAEADSLELNLEPSAVTSQFKQTRHGLASDIVPAWVDEVLEVKRY